MKIKKEFISQDLGDESFLVPTGAAEFSGIVKGNSTFGAILALMKEDTTREDVISAMKERFDAPEEIIARDVDRVLEELGKIGALDE